MREIIAWAENERKQMTIFGRDDVQKTIIFRVKAPLVKAMNLLSRGRLHLSEVIFILRTLWAVKRIIDKELPDPTQDNTWHPNTRILLDLQDYILGHVRLTPDRVNLLRVVSKFIIIVYDFDTPYRQMIDRCVERLKQSDWKLEPNTPSPRFWKE